VLLGTFVLSNPGIDETILRTVGILSVKTDAPTADEDQVGAFGMILVTDLASGAGVASLPSPIFNGDDDWFVHQMFGYSFLADTSVGTIQDATMLQFDQKARRRLTTGRVAAIVCENIHASQAFNIFWQVRMLSMVSGT